MRAADHGAKPARTREPPRELEKRARHRRLLGSGFVFGDFPMRRIDYDRRRATELLFLLGAIGREIQERSRALEELEGRIGRLSTLPFPDPDRLHEFEAEAATNRRGLRLARRELEQLGCSVVGMEPLTFRIPGRVGEAKQSFVWQTGDPILR